MNSTEHPIRAYRKANGLQLNKFAERIGISGASLSRIERGEQDPPLSLALRIREETGGAISIDDFPSSKRVGRDADLPAVWSAQGAD